MYGVDAGKLTLIVTERGKDVVSAIDQCSGRGATLLSAKGGYNGQDKQVVLCACNNKQMHQIRQAARQVDPQALSSFWNPTRYWEKALRSYKGNNY